MQGTRMVVLLPSCGLGLFIPATTLCERRRLDCQLAAEAAAPTIVSLLTRYIVDWIRRCLTSQPFSFYFLLFLGMDIVATRRTKTSKGNSLQ